VAVIGSHKTFQAKGWQPTIYAWKKSLFLQLSPWQSWLAGHFTIGINGGRNSCKEIKKAGGDATKRQSRILMG